MLVKKFLGLFYLFFILVIGGFLLNRAFSGKNSSDSSTPPPAMGAVKSETANVIKINWQGKDFQASYIKVDDPSKVDLIANFSEKLTAEQLKEKHGCGQLVNGGFYTTDGKATGYFLTNEIILKNYSSSSLFDGVFSVNDFATPRITRNVPEDHLKFGLQTGPILIENGAILKLNINNDKPARRVVAVVSGENILYFLAIYNPEQVYDGPFLNNLPEIISEVGKQTGISFADAVNLDGGSASAFYSDNLKLSEITSIGSAFCLK
jgi:exopolysaccharide biosynthesis protein